MEDKEKQKILDSAAEAIADNIAAVLTAHPDLGVCMNLANRMFGTEVAANVLDQAFNLVKTRIGESFKRVVESGREKINKANLN